MSSSSTSFLLETMSFFIPENVFDGLASLVTNVDDNSSLDVLCSYIYIVIPVSHILAKSETVSVVEFLFGELQKSS